MCVQDVVQTPAKLLVYEALRCMRVQDVVQTPSELLVCEALRRMRVHMTHACAGRGADAL